MLAPSYSGRQDEQPARGRLDQGAKSLAGDVAGGEHCRLDVPSGQWAGSPAASWPPGPRPNEPF